MSLQRIYFTQNNGYFRYGRLASQSVHIVGGIYDTSNPAIIEAARKELGKQVEAIQVVMPKVVAPVTVAEPPAESGTFLRCAVCGASMASDEEAEHMRSHAEPDAAPPVPPVPMWECLRCHTEVPLKLKGIHMAHHGREDKLNRELYKEV